MDFPVKSDITIIGAGPAGATAALSLSGLGQSCLVFDKNQFPREKICGDGLSGKVISTLNRIDPGFVAALDQSGLATGSHAVRFFSPDLDMMELSFNSEKSSVPKGFICKRIDFDNFLLEKAHNEPGIRFIGGIRINRLKRENGVVLIEDTGGRQVAETSLVLFAAGADRRLVRQLDPGYPEPSEEGIGVRGYFENVAGSDGRFAIELHFLKELLPWYLWIFPFADGSVNAGLALPGKLAAKKKLSLKELLFQLIDSYPHLKKRFENARLRGKLAAGRLPVFTGPTRVSGNNYLLLGDAARLIDPFTGEGIGNAMISGQLAAGVAARCLEKRDFSAAGTIIYQDLINEKLVPELQSGLRLQKLARRKYLLNLVIGKASRDEKTRDMIAEMLYSTKAKKKLHKLVFYLKLLLGG
jgi:geranylgeranyl reductase family protein